MTGNGVAPSPVARVGAAYRKIAEAGRLVAVKDNIDVGATAPPWA